MAAEGESIGISYSERITCCETGESWDGLYLRLPNRPPQDSWQKNCPRHRQPHGVNITYVALPTVPPGDEGVDYGMHGPFKKR